MTIWQLPTKRQPTEHEEQRDFVRWWRQNYTAEIWAIPNGGHRHKATAQKLKLEGVTRGVPDLFIPHLRIWVEMKVQKGGRLSPEQKEKIAYLQGCGYEVLVAKGSRDAQAQIQALVGAPSKIERLR